MVPNSNQIPGMNLEKNYKKSPSKEDPETAKKKFEKTKKDLEKLKVFVTKKYKFVQAMGILPPNSIRKFIEEEEAPAESKDYIHLTVIVPDEKSKEVPKIKTEIIKEIEKIKEKVWLHFFTPSEIWEICFDSKFDLSGAIGMSYSLYDTGILGALRVAEIHKSLVLQKFEKYVVSYVIGGSLVRGEAEKSSDVDVFVIINDTDVKRMPRRELLGRLRGIIYQYVSEAASLAGVKNRLEPQIYLLTDFWDAVKDAHPVMFTFIRDGVPLYDRGTFMPWKSLLRMGKLKPSPEAIDMFMNMGDEVIPRSKRTLLSDIFTNIFWGVTTPAQALVMLNGSPPPNAKKELLRDFKKLFYDTKMIEKRYVDFLENVVDTWRDYEHEKIKEISGKQIDSLLKQTEDYLKRLKELRIQIEKKYQEKTIEELHKDLIRLLKILIGNKSRETLFKEFEKNFVKKGIFTSKHLKILKGVDDARKEFKKGKSTSLKIDRARRDADILIKDLVEFNQRKDLFSVDKGRMRLKTKRGNIEVLNCNGRSFVFEGQIVKEIREGLIDVSVEEVDKCIEKQKGRETVKFDPKIFEILKKKYGSFEIVL